MLEPLAVERIKEYLEVPQEAPARVAKPPPAGWPSSSGGIAVENLVIRYAPDLPAVLKGISFTIRPQEKIGVVSFKSSSNDTDELKRNHRRWDEPALER